MYVYVSICLHVCQPTLCLSAHQPVLSVNLPDWLSALHSILLTAVFKQSVLGMFYLIKKNTSINSLKYSVLYWYLCCLFFLSPLKCSSTCSLLLQLCCWLQRFLTVVVLFYIIVCTQIWIYTHSHLNTPPHIHTHNDILVNTTQACMDTCARTHTHV